MTPVQTEYGLRSGNLIVTRGLTKEMLAAAYALLWRDGILKTFFYEWVPDVNWFVDWGTDPRSLIYGCFRLRPDGSDITDLIGLGTVNRVANSGSLMKAEVGFAFIKDAGIFEKARCGRMMLAAAFKESGADVLFGTIPEKNPAAIAYAKRLGFTAHGPIPDYTVWEGEPCGVIITRLTRKMLEEKHGAIEGR